MTDREKVIRGLECCAHGVAKCHICPYDPRNHALPVDCMTDLAKDTLELLKAQEPGWISVKDRLPCDGLFVLVCNDDGHMMIAKYESELVRWEYKYTNYDHDVWDDDEQGPVCWWMPLPEPPKEESNAP